MTMLHQQHYRLSSQLQFFKHKISARPIYL
jgi:hypothetical protein